MIFQTLDDKKECVGIYAKGQLYYDDFPKELTQTWAYSAHLSGQNVQYAQIYAQGAVLGECCPDFLKERYDRVSSKMRAFLKSFDVAKISLQENCFFDLVPERFLLEFYDVKSQITRWVFENYEKPQNHDFMRDVVAMISDISHQSFQIDRSALNMRLAESRVLNFRNKLSNTCRVKYNPWGTVTGRLSTHKGSFPILTLDRGFRDVVVSNKGVLIEIDFNAAELRTFLGLSGAAQPEGDLHSWNNSNIFDNQLTRKESKEKIFSWLYNPKSLDKRAEKYYNRSSLVKKYFNHGVVTTPMMRKIQSDERKALNYLIQSTSSDIFLNSAVKVWKMLENLESEIRFLVHDSILIDLSDSERGLLPEVVNTFSQTPLGTFGVGVSVGKSYGDMRKIR